MEKINQYMPAMAFHPGETLAEKLQEMKMGPKEFSLRTGKPEKTIIAVLKGESSITADMAVRFESVTRIPANFWMNHQRSYDEFIARKKRQIVIQEALEWANCFPLAEMVSKGWLTENGTIEERTMDMLEFFGFSNHTAWEDYYFNQQLKVAFRISLSKTKEPYAVSAWLRQGELQAAALTAEPFNQKKFKAVLPKIKSMMAADKGGSFVELQAVGLEAGVKVVQTPRISRAPISGSTRWLNDTPLIQLSETYNLKNSFWFTLFHEAGHILLHGKKDIFLENLDYSDKDMEKEREADEFAAKWVG